MEAIMRLCVTVVALLVLVTTAHAQSYGPPTFAVGDTWKRSNGREIKVVKADETGIEATGYLQTCPTCVHRMDKNLTILEVVQADGKPIDVTQHRFVPLGSDWKLLDFPLEVKRTWRITPQGFFRGSPAKYTVESTVVAYEDVKTKAGTFKAYKIQQAWTLYFRPQQVIREVSWTNVLWFAPDAKATVKFTSTNQNTQDWEVVSYSLK